RGSLRGALTTTSEEPCNSLRPLNQSLHVLVLELIESVLGIIGMYDDPRSVEVTTALERDNNLALRSVLHVRVLLRVAGLVVGRSVVSWFPSKALRLSRGEIGRERIVHLFLLVDVPSCDMDSCNVSLLHSRKECLNLIKVQIILRYCLKESPLFDPLCILNVVRHQSPLSNRACAVGAVLINTVSDANWAGHRLKLLTSNPLVRALRHRHLREDRRSLQPPSIPKKRLSNLVSGIRLRIDVRRVAHGV